MVVPYVPSDIRTSTPPTDLNVLIVESGAKAKTLQRYLGADWVVVATGGHIETLPHNRKAHGKDATKAFWANRPGELPAPPWVPTDRGEDAIRKILDEAGADATFWIATDPDREGEFIAWGLDRKLQSHGPTHRVTFQEVTREAVEAALEHPRGVDARMVDSALVRKFLDRLVGYRTSRMARSIVPGGSASMGRVQTPTLGFVVERELQREAHVPIPYFEVHAAARGIDLQVRFHEPDDPAAWKDDGGRVNPTRTFDGELAEGALAALTAAGRVRVEGVKSSTRSRRPSAPFTTDALLQAAGSRFGWSPRKTSVLASMLYEAGHITYIRTDSTRLAASAVEKARAVVKDGFGEDHLGPGARAAAGAGPTQDAHEAIRPTRLELDEPAVDDADARRLYRLVRAQTLASQMAPSVRNVVSIDASCAELDRRLTGSVSWRTFDGWEAAYREFMGDVAVAPPDVPLEEGAVWPLDPATEDADNPRLVEDETRPPPRYRPHTLIKAMKDAGIGRPSTYSRTLDKLEERRYVEMEDGSLAPTERGRAAWLDVAPLYSEPGKENGEAMELFDTDFTAQMEERLDAIARGELPAPESWERWRDQIRELHDAAREQKQAGSIVPSQIELLQRLLANAPPEVKERHEPGLASLTHREATDLIASLKHDGIKPAPTEKQMHYLRELADDLGLGEEDLHEIAGVRSLDDIVHSDQASEAITELKAVYDERRPPSRKQLQLIRSLADDLSLSEADAAALVDAASLDELTGGREGTASQLIDLLQERTREASRA